jgi:hypothetical protein
MQIVRQHQRKITNTAPATLSAIQAASQSTFINAQLYSTILVISANDKNKQLTLMRQRKYVNGSFNSEGHLKNKKQA